MSIRSEVGFSIADEVGNPNRDEDGKFSSGGGSSQGWERNSKGDLKYKASHRFIGGMGDVVSHSGKKIKSGTKAQLLRYNDKGKTHLFRTKSGEHFHASDYEVES